MSVGFLREKKKIRSRELLREMPTKHNEALCMRRFAITETRSVNKRVIALELRRCHICPRHVCTSNANNVPRAFSLHSKKDNDMSSIDTGTRAERCRAFVIYTLENSRETRLSTKYTLHGFNVSPGGDVTRWRNLTRLTGSTRAYIGSSRFYFTSFFLRLSFSGFYFYLVTRTGTRSVLARLKRARVSRASLDARASLYTFEQLVSRSFSTRALNFDTLCHSEPPVPFNPGCLLFGCE